MVSTKVKVKQDPRGKKAQAICDAWQEAEERRVAGTITKSRVEEILNQTLRSVGLAPMETPRVGRWLDDWLVGKRKISEGSRLGYEQAVREFKEFLGHRVNQPLEAVTESDIDAFVDHLRKDHRSASTVNKLVRKYLSGAFEKARKLGKIRYNPIAATDPLPNDSTVKDAFSVKEVRTMPAGGVIDRYTHADLDLIKQAVTLIPRLPNMKKNEAKYLGGDLGRIFYTGGRSPKGAANLFVEALRSYSSK
jgi:hypothetical protein